jgi:hypothetical protein
MNLQVFGSFMLSLHFKFVFHLKTKSVCFLKRLIQGIHKRIVLSVCSRLLIPHHSFVYALYTYSVTVEKVQVHISDILHVTSLSKDYIVYNVYAVYVSVMLVVKGVLKDLLKKRNS